MTEDQAKCLTTSNQRIDLETETFVVANSLDQMSGGPDDNSAQANHIVSSAFYSTGGSQQGFARTDGVSPTLKVGSGEGIASPPAVSFSQNQRGELRESDVTSQLTTGGGKPGQGYPAVRVSSIQDCREMDKAQNGLGVGEDQSYTLDKTGAQGVAAGQAVRRLTPVECERLMSWPDGWTALDGDATPDSRRYAACGNGVVSNISEWIGRRILAVEREG